MYFPYLRGRQFELIAIRELVSQKLIGGQVIPIIEPVHLTNTLIKTLEVCSSQKKQIGLVINPQVGSFAKEIAANSSATTGMIDKYETLLKNNEENIVPVFIAKNDEEERVLKGIKDGKSIILVCNDSDSLSLYKNLGVDLKGKIIFNLIKEESRIKRSTRGLPNVLFVDNFNKRDRNADYSKCIDESYTDENLFYKDEGFYGFGDYSVVGEKYSESGFAPYAVAIHIVYPVKNDEGEGQILRIHHFVSDSNDDITDIAGKFWEAVSKLMKWNKEKKLRTKGIEELERLYAQRAFPGLGVVKKLSIMHHLQLMEELSKEGNES